MPVFWTVTRIPDATPRYRAGTLFMIEVVFGAANSPKATPLREISSANSTQPKSTGSDMRPANVQAASSIPPVANGRAPHLSDIQPETGPAARNPALSGSM